jgi:hypothetical protein
MEPGLGTNPRSSGERCQWRVPTRSRTTPDAGCRERRGKERSRRVSQWRPAGFEPVADATDPYRTSRIPTPQGGWVGLRAPEKEWCWGLFQPAPPPPTPRVQRIRHYVAILFVTPNPGHTYVNPPGRFTRGLTGQKRKKGNLLSFM